MFTFAFGTYKNQWWKKQQLLLQMGNLALWLSDAAPLPLPLWPACLWHAKAWLNLLVRWRNMIRSASAKEKKRNISIMETSYHLPNSTISSLARGTAILKTPIRQLSTLKCWRPRTSSPCAMNWKKSSLWKPPSTTTTPSVSTAIMSRTAPHAGTWCRSWKRTSRTLKKRREPTGW